MRKMMKDVGGDYKLEGGVLIRKSFGVDPGFIEMLVICIVG
jgi:hypothetical protein